MEWSWRTVLILLVLLAVAAIVIDGFRRMRRARADALRLDVEPGIGERSGGGHNPELPGGGFRVIQPQPAQTSPVTAAEPLAAAVADEPLSVPAEPVAAFSARDDETDDPVPALVDDRIIPWEDELGEARVISAEQAAEPQPSAVVDLDIPPSPLIPKARPVNLDEQVPVLLDVEELGAEENSTPVIADDDQGVTADDDCADMPVAAALDDEPADDAADEQPSEPPLTAAAAQPVSAAMAEALAVQPEIQDEVDNIPPALPLQPVNFASAGAEKLSDRPAPDVVLEIHCIARDPAGFSGKDILFLFNSCDLCFGEKDIFHRFELPDSQGCIQFSVAQSFNPGIFVPAAMPQQHFRGLSFFMSLPGAHKPLEAYDAMSGMAMVLARQLNAELYDGARSALTHQTIEHDRQQIIDFERRRQLAAKKHARS